MSAADTALALWVRAQTILNVLSSIDELKPDEYRNVLLGVDWPPDVCREFAKIAAGSFRAHEWDGDKRIVVGEASRKSCYITVQGTETREQAHAALGPKDYSREYVAEQTEALGGDPRSNE